MSASQNVKTLDEKNFTEEVLNQKGPVLVDFWAPWCPPCKAIAPVIESVADEFAGDATVGKVDVDDNASLASKYNIASIPTLVYFKDSEVVDSVRGVVPRQVIADKLTALSDSVTAPGE
ncbi:MAG: thioredoxin [Planctomycetota bacterium]|jgi:thioredoxin 1